MAFIPFNAKASLTPTGGSSGLWTASISLTDVSGQYANSNVVVGCIVFTFSTTNGHMVAWKVNQVNGGSAPPAFGAVPVRLEYYDPRTVGASTEPATGPQADSTGLICNPSASGDLFITSYVLNSIEQRKAAEIENLNRLFKQSGASASANQYTHTQAVAATTWNVVHNLGSTAIDSIHVWNAANEPIVPGIAIVDANSLTLTFGLATAGRAVIEL